MTFLVDTNVLSELSKNPPNLGVLRWFGAVRPSETFLSVAVIAEIRSGIENCSTNRYGINLRDWLDHTVRPRFAGRIVGVDEAIADLWGQYDFRLRQLSVKEPTMDALIAATAVVHGHVVVTRNVKHFEPLGVPVLNPCTLQA